MAADSQTITQIKAWLFPTLIAILGTIIWNDVKEIKNDVKSLMAQSNIDKTRIDNLEKQVERLFPHKSIVLSGISPYNSNGKKNVPLEAIPHKDLFVDSRQKKYLLSDVNKKKRNII